MSLFQAPRLRRLASFTGQLADTIVEVLRAPESASTTGIDGLLADRLAAARGALADGRPDDVVDALQETLVRLQAFEAGAWSILGSAYGQLGRRRDRDKSFRRSVSLYDGIETELLGREAMDAAVALAAVGRLGDGRKVLRAAMEASGDVASLELLRPAFEEIEDWEGAAMALAKLAALTQVAEEARSWLERAVALAPAPERRIALAEVLVTLGDVEAAAAELELAGSDHADDSKLLALQAQVARLRQDPERALDIAERAVRQDPDEYLGHAARGLALADLGHFEQALSSLSVALELKPGDIRLSGERAALLLRLGRVEEAGETIRAAAAEPGDDPALAALHAEVLRRRGRVVDALDVLDDAIESNGSVAELHAERAWALLASGRDDDALEEANKALAIDADDATALVTRAEILQRRGRRVEALGDLERVPVEDRRYAAAIGVRGRVYANQQEDDRALEAFESARRLDPTLTWVIADEARVLLRSRPDDAWRMLQEAVTLHQRDANLWRLLAWSALLSGHEAESLEAAKTALQLAPEDVDSQHIHGLLQLRAGDYDEALQTFEQALQLAGGDRPDLTPELHIRHAESLTGLGRHADADVEYSAVLDEDPDSYLARLGRAHSRYGLGDHEGAIGDLRAAVQRAGSPDERATSLVWLGEMLRRSGEYAEALDALDQARDSAPDSAFAHGTRGQVLAALPDRQLEAIQELQRATELDPGSAWAHTSLAEALRRAERYPEALEVLAATLALAPHDAYALGTRGQVLAAVGRYSEAVLDLCRAAAQEPFLWVVDELERVVSDLSTDRDALRSALVELQHVQEKRPELKVLARIQAEGRWSLGQLDDSLRLLEQHLADVPDDFAALATKAHVLVDLRRSGEALQIASLILGHEPGDPRALAAQVRALLDLRRHREALEVIRVARAEGNTDAWFTAQQANILAVYGRFDDALKLVRSLVERNPDDSFAHAVAGYSLRRLEDPHRAAEHLGRAVALESANLSYLNEQGDCHFELGRPAAAEAAHLRVLQLISDEGLTDHGANAAAGWSLYRLKRHEEAVARANESLIVDPESLLARLFLGLVLLHTGRPELALDEYEGAAELAAGMDDGDLVTGWLGEGLRDLRQARPELSDDLAEVALAAEHALTRVLEDPRVEQRRYHRAEEEALHAP